jgi:hypothetical protein
MTQGSAGMPGPVVTSSTATIKQAQKRTGLMRMTIGSQHMIQMPGWPRAMGVVARDWHDCSGAKVEYLCLNERCAGKRWPTHEAMRVSHGESAEMAKRGEAHVYGMWSDDTLDAEGLAEARAAAKKAAEELKEVKKLPITTLADREAVKEIAEAAAKAQAAAEAANVCIGLIAPPEPRYEDL